MADEPTRPFKFESKAEGTCLCGLKFSVGYVDDHPTVLHPLPMCETFNRFESPVTPMPREFNFLRDEHDRELGINPDSVALYIPEGTASGGWQTRIWVHGGPPEGILLAITPIEFKRMILP